MTREHREWTDRFSEYLDGTLDAHEAGRVEAHLGECGACREVMAGLREVVARAAELGEAEPPRDLWPGIASAIRGPARDGERPTHASVIALPTAHADGVARRSSRVDGLLARRSWLAAAAAGLVALSVGSTWWVATSTLGPPGGVASPAASSADPVVAVQSGAPPADLAGELAALEEVLAAARGALDPNTVRVLERNLGVIEQAIADSREALALDPGNAFLAQHLERMYRRKLVYLQDAVRVVQWSG